VATHYDILGVRADAPTEDLRRAYLHQARELHPDRAVTRPSGDAAHTARRMQEVNEAWRVLRDPMTRAAYDRSLSTRRQAWRPVPSAESAGSVDDDDLDDLDIPFEAPLAEPGDLTVSLARALPWVAIIFVLMAIFVFTAFAGGRADDDGPRSLDGRCVSSGSASAVRAVPCEGPNDGQVVLIVDRASLCPSGSTSRAVEGNEWLCLEPFDPDKP
jgi:curved DNA-binding protein CbpA